MKKQIAFLPLTPLGDAVLSMGELEELHRVYDPCEITVFAIPLVAELFRCFRPCDHVVEVNGGVHGEVSLENVPEVEYDAVFNHGYEPWWTEIVRRFHYRKAYGMEEAYRTAKECEEIFDKWVSLDYWKAVTMKKYRHVSQQNAELIRLVSPEFIGNVVRLSRENFSVSMPPGMPRQRYMLFLPGTSALFKHYPTTKVLALARVANLMGFEAVFAVGPQDRKVAEELTNGGHRIFESPPLSELAGLVCGAALVVGNDSGPMHFAAAFDKPTIHLFSFSGAHTWFSYSGSRHQIVMAHCGRRDGVDCGRCARTCIGKIPVQKVVSIMAELVECESPPVKRIAYLAQDLIGDVLVWLNHLEALSIRYAPCTITVFCAKPIKSVLESYAFVDHVIAYDATRPWSQQEVDSFGDFDAVFNTRYDGDSLLRVIQLHHDKAYGFENIEIPEESCKVHYAGWLPLSLWDDFHLRRKTSVTNQGSELIRIVEPEYRCDYVRLDETTYIHDFTEGSLFPENRIVFVLGASDRTKHWGTGRYISLALRMKKRGHVPVFLLGPSELDYEREIVAHGFTVFKNLDFSKIAALFSRTHGARCVVGNDTGLMHFACMLGAPSVSIIPLGAHYTWFPYAADERAQHIACTPYCAHPMCSQRCPKAVQCVDLIELAAVEEATNRVLS